MTNIQGIEKEYFTSNCWKKYELFQKFKVNYVKVVDLFSLLYYNCNTKEKNYIVRSK